MKDGVWTPQAVSDLLDVALSDPRTAVRIQKAALQFLHNGSGDVKKLSGPGDEWRLRVRDWRVRYVYYEYPHRLRFLRVLNRRDA